MTYIRQFHLQTPCSILNSKKYLDSCRSWCAIDKCELTKRCTFTDCTCIFSIDIDLTMHIHMHTFLASSSYPVMLGYDVPLKSVSFKQKLGTRLQRVPIINDIIRMQELPSHVKMRNYLGCESKTSECLDSTNKFSQRLKLSLKPGFLKPRSF